VLASPPPSAHAIIAANIEPVLHAPPPRSSTAQWLRTFVSSLLLIFLGIGLAQLPGLSQPAAPAHRVALPSQLSASPDYAYVMTLWLNLQSIASVSNALDESAVDLRNHAITYGYFRIRANRLGEDIGRYNLEARQIQPPANLRDLHDEYIAATDELMDAANILTDALVPEQPNAGLLAQSDQRRDEAVRRLEAVGDQLLDRVWHRTSRSVQQAP